MPEIDIKRVLDKIRVIEDSLSKLKTLAQLSLDEFISDFKYFDSAKYNLQTAIEAMIDIGNHIISRRGLGIPKTYADTFEILQKSGIIAKKDADIYKLMAKFRNRIVHFYDEVDDKEVYRVLQNNLGDFDSFIQQISKLLISS
ncbi:type VII toxin-antitoxin system HepT family RNase toxin [Thermoanaerobacterium sp. DL9XJH110]|uniref:type VII toxin-antitoxin system HepT family RNase toxin n=1 Tax=Thermoanaerobacterium sp. DL9XJH110 TaxID=3386643 RepID=UPI003BB61971